MRDGPAVDPLVDRLAAAPEMHRRLCGGHVFGSEVIHHALPSVVECWSYRSSKSIKWTPPGPDGWRVGSLPRSIQRRMVRIDTPAISATWRTVYKRLGLFILFIKRGLPEGLPRPPPYAVTKSGGKLPWRVSPLALPWPSGFPAVVAAFPRSRVGQPPYPCF